MAALTLGALEAGLLSHQARPEDLIDGVRLIAAGEAMLAPAVARRLISLFVTGSHPGTHRRDPRLDALTGRELEVFRLLAQGMSNAEIAAALYITGNTVKTHVARVLSKLDLRDRVHAVIFAHQSGPI